MSNEQTSVRYAIVKLSNGEVVVGGVDSILDEATGEEVPVVTEVVKVINPVLFYYDHERKPSRMPYDAQYGAPMTKTIPFNWSNVLFVRLLTIEFDGDMIKAYSDTFTTQKPTEETSDIVGASPKEIIT